MITFAENKNIQILIRKLKNKRYSDNTIWRILFLGNDLLKAGCDLLDLKATYYKYVYRRKILNTKSIHSNNDLELHLLSCKRDFYNSMWAIKTFCFFSDLKFKIVIHDDGSLTNIQKKILSQHFRSAQIIEKKYADIKMKGFLTNYYYLLKYRTDKKFYLLLKLLDPLFFSKSENLLILDSDILFFKKPTEILQCIDNEIPFFLADCNNAYTHTVSTLKKLIEIDVMEKINSGLIYFNKTDYLKNISLMESFCKKISVINYEGDINKLEQTAHAVLLSKLKAKRLSDNYQISNEKISNDTVAYHFVNDGLRNNMYKKGLVKLKTEKFIEKFNSVISQQA